MIRNLTRRCDLCHRAIPPGKYHQRNADPQGLDFLLVLLENQDGFDLSENPDGTVAIDTCRDCYIRMAFSHSNSLN